MFERFAEEARRATALASAEAREMGHDFIGTEHLLLGLVATGEGVAFSVLTELEVTLEDARAKVMERVHAYGSGSVESPPFTPLAKKSMERALRESLKLNSDLIGTEHLLLGLVAVPDGGGARVLVELAGSVDQVREAVLARLGATSKADTPLEQTKAPVTSRTLRRWATQGLLVLRPASGGSEKSPGEPEGENVAEPAAGPPPRCPACGASLVTEARYRQLPVPPDDEPDDEPHLDLGPNPALGPDPDEAEGLSEPIIVKVVYCGHCGTALGVA